MQSQLTATKAVRVPLSHFPKKRQNEQIHILNEKKTKQKKKKKIVECILGVSTLIPTKFSQTNGRLRTAKTIAWSNSGIT